MENSFWYRYFLVCNQLANNMMVGYIPFNFAKLMAEEQNGRYGNSQMTRYFLNIDTFFANTMSNDTLMMFDELGMEELAELSVEQIQKDFENYCQGKFRFEFSDESDSEIELIDIAFDNKDRIENKVTEIVPPVGIKNMVLSYSYKWGVWFIRFARLENNNGYPFIAEYDICDNQDGTYKAYKGKEGSEFYDFRYKSENEMLKIALAFTAEQLNKMADESTD